MHKILKNEAILCRSIAEALSFLEGKANIETCWVIGGYSIYNEAMELKSCNRIYLTQIDQDFECDVFFPQISTEKFIDISDHTMDVTVEMQEEGDITYRYKVFENKH